MEKTALIRSNGLSDPNSPEHSACAEIPGTGATALVMAHPKDCFAVSMPYGTESHHSLYLSLFGRTIKAGETDTAHASLVLGEELSNEEVIELYRSYLREIDKESAPKTED
jgi:hypothetical protein